MMMMRENKTTSRTTTSQKNVPPNALFLLLAVLLLVLLLLLLFSLFLSLSFFPRFTKACSYVQKGLFLRQNSFRNSNELFVSRV